MIKSPPLENFEEFAAYLAGKQINTDLISAPTEYPCVLIIDEQTNSWVFSYLSDFLAQEIPNKQESPFNNVVWKVQ